MTSPKTSLAFLGLLFASLGFAACASSTNTGGDDAGNVPPTPDATVFKTPDATGGTDTTLPQNDAMSIFGGGDTGGGTPDATTNPDAVGVDARSGDGSPMGDAATTSEGGTTDAGTKDGAAKDSGSDTGPAKDAGCVAVGVPTSSSGTCTFTTTSCAPGALPTPFTPTAPTPVKQAICSTAEIQNYYNGCLSPSSTNTTCQAATVSAPCYACLVTPQTAAAWGPLIATTNTLVQLNVGGCLDLTEPCNHACAVAVNDDLQCEQASCAKNCPITDSASQTAFSGCAEMVDGCGANGCGSYFAGTDCTANITGPGTVCTQQVGSNAQFETAFLAIAPLFCGM